MFHMLVLMARFTYLLILTSPRELQFSSVGQRWRHFFLPWSYFTSSHHCLSACLLYSPSLSPLFSFTYCLLVILPYLLFLPYSGSHSPLFSAFSLLAKYLSLPFLLPYVCPTLLLSLLPRPLLLPSPSSSNSYNEVKVIENKKKCRGGVCGEDMLSNPPLSPQFPGLK